VVTFFSLKKMSFLSFLSLIKERIKKKYLNKVVKKIEFLMFGV